jgi:hypothetical protein
MMQEKMLSINDTYHNFIMPDIGCKKECNYYLHSGNNAAQNDFIVYAFLSTFQIFAFAFLFLPSVLPVFLNFLQSLFQV